MSISRQIWRGTALVSGASLLSRVGTFLANLAIIRLLGRDLIGQLGLIESWLGFATLFSLAGIGVGITKFVAEHWEADTQRVGGIAGTSLLIGCATSLLVGIVVWAGLALGILVRGNVGHILQTYSGLFLCLILVLSLRQIVTSVIYGLQTFQVLIGANVVVGMLSFPLSYFLVKQHRLQGALEARLLLSCVETLWLTWAMARTLRRGGTRLHLKQYRRDGSQLLTFGLPTFIGQLASNPVQPFVLSLLAAQPAGLAQVGFITIAQRLVSLVNFFPGSLASTLTPILSSEWGSGDQARFRQGALLSLRLCWLCALPIVVFFMAGVPGVLGHLYGRDFVGAWPVTFVLLLVSLLTSLNETADRSFIAAGRVWLSTSNNFAWLALFLPLAWWLIPSHGAMGYAVAFLETFELYVGLQMWWLYRLFGVNVRSLSPMLWVSVVIVGAAWVLASKNQMGGAVALSLLTVGVEARYFLSSGEKEALARRFGTLRIIQRLFTRFAKA